MKNEIIQTPEEYLNWTIDWSKRGLGTDTIVGSVWEGSSAEFTISNESIGAPAVNTTMFLTGGTPGSRYFITNTITTSSGLEMSETVVYCCILQRMIGQEPGECC